MIGNIRTILSFSDREMHCKLCSVKFKNLVDGITHYDDKHDCSVLQETLETKNGMTCRVVYVGSTNYLTIHNHTDAFDRAMKGIKL